MATLGGIVEIFTFMKPLIRLRRNPYVRKGAGINTREREKRTDKKGLSSS